MIRLTSPINLLLLIIGAAATLTGFLLVSPGIDLPIHWGLDGQIDATLPRNWALLQMPAAIAGVWLIFWAIGRYGNAERQQASNYVLNATLPAVTGLLVLVQILIVLVGLGVVVDVIRAIIVGLALLQIVLGNALPKSRPNWIAGIRIPTTMNDPANWQATHRLAGLLMIVGGVVTFIGVLLLPAGASLLLVALSALLAPLLIASVYSLVLAARARKPAA